jgi:hypothetical protein
MKTEYQLIKEYIEQNLEGTITYDNCDSALVGIAKLIREDIMVDVAIYSYERLVNHFKQEYLSDTENPITEDEAEIDAIEWVDYNIAGGYLGIYTPLIISME